MSQFQDFRNWVANEYDSTVLNSFEKIANEELNAQNETSGLDLYRVLQRAIVDADPISAAITDAIEDETIVSD